jgi:hypothetical protein
VERGCKGQLPGVVQGRLKWTGAADDAADAGCGTAQLPMVRWSAHTGGTGGDTGRNRVRTPDVAAMSAVRNTRWQYR